MMFSRPSIRVGAGIKEGSELNIDHYDIVIKMRLLLCLLCDAIINT